MTTFALIVAGIALLATFGLVSWLRRVVACVDAPPGATGAGGLGDDTTTRPGELPRRPQLRDDFFGGRDLLHHHRRRIGGAAQVPFGLALGQQRRAP